MDEESAKRALIEARWDKENRRRESIRAVKGLLLIIGAVIIGLVVLSLWWTA